MRVESVVLLDEEGAPVGTAPKGEVHHADTPLHLGFSCYVLDADDRLLVTRRATTKRTFPGVWTNSFCGHPLPGEPLVGAVRRRASDELGLRLDSVTLVLPDFRYRAEQLGVVENEMCPVTVARVTTGVALDPDPGEVDAWVWVPWADFAAEVQAGERPVSPWCAEQVALLARLGPPGSWVATGDLPPALCPPHVTSGQPSTRPLPDGAS